MVRSCVTTAPPGLRQYLESMSNMDNIPRKEKQFRNWASNSLSLRGTNASEIVGGVWKVLQTERERRQKIRETEQQAETKRKEEDAAAQKAQKEKATKKDPLKTNGKLDAKRVKKATKKALRKAPNKSMKIKDLRKLLAQELELDKSARKELKDMMIRKPVTKITQIDGKWISLISSD